MIIGINALFVIPNQVGGTEYHLRSFVQALAENNSGSKYLLFCNQENFQTFEVPSTNWEKVLCPIRAGNRLVRIFYEQFQLPKLVEKYQCDILHSFGYFGPIKGNFKKVLTVHDANWKDQPDDTSKIQNIVLNFLITQSIKTAGAVVTDSHFAQQRLLHYFPYLRSKLHILYPGIETRLKTLLHSKPQSRPLDTLYILCVSSFYPHKKVTYLINLWQKCTKLHQRYTLVIIGQHGKDAVNIAELVKDTPKILRIDKVSLQELAAWYQSASVFILPSIYEGFGYPVYEASFAHLSVIVGKKSLYHPNLQPQLSQLSFTFEKDCQLLATVLENTSEKSLSLDFLSYQQAAKALQKLYAELMVQ